MRKKYATEHVMVRDGVYYYVRHIPYDLTPIYSVTRLCFRLKTKSLKAAIRTPKSLTQRLIEDTLFTCVRNVIVRSTLKLAASNKQLLIDQVDNLSICISADFTLIKEKPL